MGDIQDIAPWDDEYWDDCLADQFNILEDYTGSELIIGLVGAVGTDFGQVTGFLKNRLGVAGYESEEISVSEEILEEYKKCTGANEYCRISDLMDAGNHLRQTYGKSIIGLGIAATIFKKRKDLDELRLPFKRKAFVIRSFKHPNEIEILRKIYPLSFYAIGIHASEADREKYLIEQKGLSQDEAKKLIARDENEDFDHGQKLMDTFHLSDFFIHLSAHTQNSIKRILDILFGDPFATPTFDEYAMFTAFTASLRSADLSRQIGAVIADENKSLILSTGANECPAALGGHYWTKYDVKTGEFIDVEHGKDHKRREDSNKKSIFKICESIGAKLAGTFGGDADKYNSFLQKTELDDLTEYGRVVHAEMDALLSCARSTVSTNGMTLYGTTFPCHNCAKHIISAGITRVVYIEPYPKSKAESFHKESIILGSREDASVADEYERKEKILFEPFIGIGPRKFLDLFSMKHGHGGKKKRKQSNGDIKDWQYGKDCNLRLQMLPFSYLDLENIAAQKFVDEIKSKRKKDERSS